MRGSSFFAVAAAMALFAGCHRSAAVVDGGPEPSASTSASSASTDEDPDDETPALAVNSGCPVGTHPGYCRGRCRSFSDRKRSLHASRIRMTSAVGLGTCGTLDVFAENDSTSGDAGIIEFYDGKGQLAAAVDHRLEGDGGCGRFAATPTCEPKVLWGPPIRVKISAGDTGTGLTSAVVARVFTQNTLTFRGLYLAARVRGVVEHGTIELAITIDEAGAPTKVKPTAKTTIQDATLIDAIVQKAKESTFPAPDPKAKVDTTVDFVFGE